MAKKYVPAGVLLTCTQGTAPATLVVTTPSRASVYGQAVATHLDQLPVLNVPPMGICAVTHLPCVVQPAGWNPVKTNVKFGQGYPLLEDSKLQCGAGGRVSIHFDLAAAQAACPPPPPPEKSVFDQAEDSLKDLPGPLKDYAQLQLGIAEGVWEGGKGLVEGLWTLAKGGWSAVTHPADTAKAIAAGTEKAYQWAGKSENWSAAAASAKKGVGEAASWAGNGENWEKVGDHLQHLSPRDWGKVVGQVGFEVGMTVASAGALEALNVAAKTSRLARVAVRVAELSDLEGLALKGAGKLASTLAGQMKVLGKLLTGAKRARRAAARLRRVRRAVARSPLAQKLKGAALAVWDKLMCWGDPVDVASGVMLFDQVDFELPGPLPLVWSRWWYSNSAHDGPLGRGWHHSYDAALLTNETEVAVRLPDGRLAVFAQPVGDERVFHRAERLELARDAAGCYLLWSLDERRTYCFAPLAVDAPRPLGTVAATLGETAYRLARVADANGFTTALAYDAQGQLRTLTDCAGRQVRLHYDAQGRITALEAPEPAGDDYAVAVRYAYDETGHLLTVTDALDQAQHYAYRPDHLMVQKTFRVGVSFYFEYVGTGTSAQCVRTWGDGGILPGRLEFEPGRTIVRTDAPGDVHIYEHSNGLVTRYTDPLEAVYESTYNVHNELVLGRNPLGHATSCTYDARGNRTRITYPDGAKVHTQFNAQDLPVQTTDANGGVWAYVYDEVGNLLGSTDPIGTTTQHSYNEHGLLAETSDISGQNTRLRYNAQYCVSQVISPNGQADYLQYDALGRVTKLLDAQGNELTRQYDSLGRVIAIREPTGTQKVFVYDSEDNITKIQDEQRTIEFSFNALSQVISRAEGAEKVHYSYDLEGRLINLRNGTGETHTFTLDAAGRIASERGFDGLTRHYLRDAAGQITETQRPAGRFSRYLHDPMGRVTQIEYQDGERELFSYRPDGELVTAQNKHQTVQLTKDSYGRVIREVQGTYTVASSFDLLGQRVALSSSLGTQLALQWNDSGQIERLAAGNWQARFTYNAFGQEIARQLGGLQLSFQHDANGRLAQQTIQSGRSNAVRRRRYRWQGPDRLVEIDDSLSGLTRFTHNSRGQLTAAHHPDSSDDARYPDAVGNLFRSPKRTDRHYGKSGQLREGEGIRYKYDEEGNLVRKTLPTGKVWRYFWDGAGQLVRVLRPDGYAVTFAYDALGRRISKRFRGKVTQWVWDGDKPLHEWYTLDVGPGAGSVQDLTTWLFEEGSFAPAAKLTAHNTYSVVCDHLGTPLELYDAQNVQVWGAAFDTYGAVRQGQGKPQDCPFRYQGQYEDNETGLYYNRFRYYDPQGGTYISQDPIGLAGGGQLYAYVQDPTRWVDVLGLDQIFATQGQLGEHDILRQIVGGGQSHHLNQNAAFRSVIPWAKGMAVKLKGNAITDINSNHYKAHKSLEKFWDQYRKGGAKFPERPTNLEYTKALRESLRATSLSPAQIQDATRAAIKQRVEYELLGGEKVPEIPGRLIQCKGRK